MPKLEKEQIMEREDTPGYTQFLTIWAGRDLLDDEWNQIRQDLEEFFAKHPKFHDVDFEVYFEEVPGW